MEHRITTPQGIIVTGNGNSAELKWSPSFSTVWTASMNKKQAFIDSEVLRLSAHADKDRTPDRIRSDRYEDRLWRGHISECICRKAVLRYS